jgi:NAD+-dependent farnesol dehydrogenase
LGLGISLGFGIGDLGFSLAQMQVLVTGGTGYLGRAVASAIIARGHNVVLYARGATTSGLPGRAIDGDIRDADAVHAAAAGCHAIVHMAALVSIWRPRTRDFDEVNVNGLRNVLAAAKTAGARKVLYTSSFLALPPSDGSQTLNANDYQRTKVVAEQVAVAAEKAGIPLIRLYPGVLYGPGELTEGNLVGRLIRDHLARRLPGVIGPKRIWSYAYVDDVARGYVEALERGRIGTQYRLGGENVPQRRVFEIVREITGRSLPWRVPYTAAAVIGTVEELRARFTGALPLLTRGTVEIFRHDWALDSSEAMRDLDYRITPLADGIRRTLESL